MATLIRCDHCRDPQRDAADITVDVRRRIPRHPAPTGRTPKSTNESLTVSPVQLCGPCAERLAYWIGDAIQGLREASWTLPDLPEIGEADTVDLTQGEAPEAPAEHQETLALGPVVEGEASIVNPPESAKGKRKHG